MHDSGLLAEEAEKRVAFELLRYDILVAKPLFDKQGADLLAMLRVDDGARFIRVQCKGRSLEASHSCHFDIPKAYVTNSFVVFLYLRSATGPNVFIFFSKDISSWNINKKCEYSLSLSAKSFSEKLHRFQLDGEKAKQLAELIQTVDMREQFQELIVLNAHPAKGREKDKRVVYSDDFSEVYVERSEIGIWETTSINKSTGTRSARAPCPGKPDDFTYDPISDIWRAS